MGRLREWGGHSVTPDLLILTFITYTHSVPRVLGTKGSHWVVVGRETELGNWGRGEAGQALKVQGSVLSPSQDREIWAAATLPFRLLGSRAWPPPQSYRPPGRSHSGSQLSKGSFSQLCSSSVCPRPCLSETAPLHLCLPVPALFCLIPLLISISILVSIHVSPPRAFSVSVPASLSFSVPLCLCLVPISIPALLLQALQLLSPFLSLRTHFPLSPISLSSMSHPCLHLCTCFSRLFLHHCFYPFLFLCPLFIHVPVPGSVSSSSESPSPSWIASVVPGGMGPRWGRG